MYIGLLVGFLFSAIASNPLMLPFIEITQIIRLTCHNKNDIGIDI